MSSFAVGVDLGQRHDPTAIVVVERFDASPEIHVRHVERVPLGTAYPAVVDRVSSLVRSPRLVGACSLAVDATGVGRPVVDLFHAAGLVPLAVTITAGTSAVIAGSEHKIPKRDLVGALQVLLQTGRIKIAARMADRAALVEEMLSFKVAISVAARETFGAESGAHDDLVLALALACYGAREAPAIAPVAGVSEPYRDEDEDDPYDWSWMRGAVRSMVASFDRPPAPLPGVSSVTPPPRRLPPYFVR